MEIVPTTNPAQMKQAGLDELQLRKAELRQQIQQQKELISTSSQRLLSPASISSYILGSFQKSLNLVDGLLIGYKMVRSFRRLIRKFR
jgi:hypothetical protein